MSKQRFVQQWMSKGMAIALFAVTSPTTAIASTPLQLAQVPEISCITERQQALQSRLAVLQENFGRQVERQDFRQAGQTWATLVQSMRSLDLSTRVPYLTTLLLEDAAQGSTQWRQLIDHVVKTGDSTVITPALFEAVQTVESLTSGYSFYKTQLFTELAQIYTEIQQPEQAAQLLGAALQSSRGIQGAEFATKALTPIADAYVALGDTEMALTVLRQSQQFAEQVNHPLYPARRGLVLAQVASVYARAGEIQPALELSQRIENDPYDQGNAQMEIVRAYLKADKPDAAYELAQSITNPEWKAPAIAAVAEQAVSQGDRARAISLFSEALDAAQGADVAFLDVMRQYARAVPEGALSEVSSLPSPEYRLSALAHIARTYEQAGEVGKASAVLDQMVVTLKEVPMDWQGFEVLNLVDQAIAAGAYQQAIRLTLAPEDTYIYYERAALLGKIARVALEEGNLDAAEQAIAAIPSNSLDGRSQALQALAVAYVQDNQVDQALALVDQFNEAERAYRVQVLAAIAAEVYRIGGIDPATPLFNQVLQEAEALTSPEDQILALGAIAQAYGATGQSSQAEELLPKIQQQVSAIPDPFTSSGVLQRLVESFSTANQHNLALQTTLLIPEENQRSYILSTAIAQAVDAGQYGVVLPLLNTLPSPEQQTRLLLDISDRYQQAGQLEDASRLLNQALQTAQRIPDPESRQLSFGVDGGTIVDDDSDRASMLEAIALRHAQLGNEEAALRASSLIQAQSLRDRVNQRIACW